VLAALGDLLVAGRVKALFVSLLEQRLRSCGLHRDPQCLRDLDRRYPHMSLAGRAAGVGGCRQNRGEADGWDKGA